MSLSHPLRRRRQAITELGDEGVDVSTESSSASQKSTNKLCPLGNGEELCPALSVYYMYLCYLRIFFFCLSVGGKTSRAAIRADDSFLTDYKRGTEGKATAATA